MKSIRKTFRPKYGLVPLVHLGLLDGVKFRSLDIMESQVWSDTFLFVAIRSLGMLEHEVKAHEEFV